MRSDGSSFTLQRNVEINKTQVRCDGIILCICTPNQRQKGQYDCGKNDFPTRTNEAQTVSTISDGSSPVAVVSALRYLSDFNAVFAPRLGSVADAASGVIPVTTGEANYRA